MYLIWAAQVKYIKSPEETRPESFLIFIIFIFSKSSFKTTKSISDSKSIIATKVCVLSNEVIYYNIMVKSSDEAFIEAAGDTVHFVWKWVLPVARGRPRRKGQEVRFCSSRCGTVAPQPGVDFWPLQRVQDPERFQKCHKRNMCVRVTEWVCACFGEDVCFKSASYFSRSKES